MVFILFSLFLQILLSLLILRQLHGLFVCPRNKFLREYLGKVFDLPFPIFTIFWSVILSLMVRNVTHSPRWVFSSDLLLFLGIHDTIEPLPAINLIEISPSFFVNLLRRHSLLRLSRLINRRKPLQPNQRIKAQPPLLFRLLLRPLDPPYLLLNLLLPFHNLQLLFMSPQLPEHFGQIPYFLQLAVLDALHFPPINLLNLSPVIFLVDPHFIADLLLFR